MQRLTDDGTSSSSSWMQQQQLSSSPFSQPQLAQGRPPPVIMYSQSAGGDFMSNAGVSGGFSAPAASYVLRAGGAQLQRNGGDTTIAPAPMLSTSTNPIHSAQQPLPAAVASFTLVDMPHAQLDPHVMIEGCFDPQKAEAMLSTLASKLGPQGFRRLPERLFSRRGSRSPPEIGKVGAPVELAAAAGAGEGARGHPTSVQPLMLPVALASSSGTGVGGGNSPTSPNVSAFPSSRLVQPVYCPKLFELDPDGAAWWTAPNASSASSSWQSSSSGAGAAVSSPLGKHHAPFRTCVACLVNGVPVRRTSLPRQDLVTVVQLWKARRTATVSVVLPPGACRATTSDSNSTTSNRRHDLFSGVTIASERQPPPPPQSSSSSSSSSSAGAILGAAAGQHPPLRIIVPTTEATPTSDVPLPRQWTTAPTTVAIDPSVHLRNREVSASRSPIALTVETKRIADLFLADVAPGNGGNRLSVAYGVAPGAVPFTQPTQRRADPLSAVAPSICWPGQVFAISPPMTNVAAGVASGGRAPPEVLRTAAGSSTITAKAESLDDTVTGKARVLFGIPPPNPAQPVAASSCFSHQLTTLMRQEEERRVANSPATNAAAACSSSGAPQPPLLGIATGKNSLSLCFSDAPPSRTTTTFPVMKPPLPTPATVAVDPSVAPSPRLVAAPAEDTRQPGGGIASSSEVSGGNNPWFGHLFGLRTETGGAGSMAIPEQLPQTNNNHHHGQVSSWGISAVPISRADEPHLPIHQVPSATSATTGGTQDEERVSLDGTAAAVGPNKAPPSEAEPSASSSVAAAAVAEIVWQRGTTSSVDNPKTVEGAADAAEGNTKKASSGSTSVMDDRGMDADNKVIVIRAIGSDSLAAGNGPVAALNSVPPPPQDIIDENTRQHIRKLFGLVSSA